MQIFFDIDNRLPDPDRGRVYYENGNFDEDYFLIVHPDDDDDDCVGICNSEMQKDHCRGILFVKGTPYANLGRELANKLQRKYNNKVHFLSYAVALKRRLATGIRR